MASAAKYQPYPAYKPSGVEWVGDIPDGWDVRPLFGVAATESRKNETGEEKNVLSLSYGNIVSRDVETNFGLLPASFNTYQLVEVGEIILRLTDLQNDKRSLRVGHSKQKGIITSAYLKLIAKKTFLSDYYLYLLLHSYDTTKVFYGMGGGLRQSMKFEEMRRLPILIPPLPEQTKIAAFLDYETGKIDGLIAKQQRLIALLEEKRQAVISHAVTKGLDPTAPLRPSGIDWLGDVPAHWEAMKLKYPISVKGGYAFSSESFTDTGKKVIRIGDIDTRGVISLQDAKCIPSSAARQFSAYEVTAGYILMAMTGATIGKAGWYTESEPALLNQRVGAFECNKEKISSRFFWYVLKSEGYQKYVTLTAFGGAQPNISDTQMLDYSIVLPKMTEQQNIADFLDMESTRFDALSDKARAASNLLRERRTALISAAVTGKIDLRGWEAPTDATGSTQDKEVLA